MQRTTIDNNRPEDYLDILQLRFESSLADAGCSFSNTSLRSECMQACEIGRSFHDLSLEYRVSASP